MVGAYSASVFALEPLDPDGRLSSSERSAWESALEHDHYSLGLWLDSRTEAALRRKLKDEYPTYDFIRQALADPLGEKGQKVFVDITEDDMLVARY